MALAREVIDWVTAWVTTLPPSVAYLVAASVVIAETGVILGVFLPAEPLLLFTGYLVARGDLDLVPALTVTTLAALGGDWLAYLSGRRVGPRLRSGRLGRRVGADRWARADALFDRHGGCAVLLGRWLAFIRTLTPRLAGATRLAPGRFAAWDLAAVLVWVPGSVLAGYLAGASYERLSDRFSQVTLVLLGAVLLGWVVVRLRRRRRAAAGR